MQASAFSEVWLRDLDRYLTCTQGAVLQLSKCAAIDLGKYGIRYISLYGDASTAVHLICKQYQLLMSWLGAYVMQGIVHRQPESSHSGSIQSVLDQSSLKAQRGMQLVRDRQWMN